MDADPVVSRDSSASSESSEPSESSESCPASRISSLRRLRRKGRGRAAARKPPAPSSAASSTGGSVVLVASGVGSGSWLAAWSTLSGIDSGRAHSSSPSDTDGKGDSSWPAPIPANGDPPALSSHPAPKGELTCACRSGANRSSSAAPVSSLPLDAGSIARSRSKRSSSLTRASTSSSSRSCANRSWSLRGPLRGTPPSSAVSSSLWLPASSAQVRQLLAASSHSSRAPRRTVDRSASFEGRDQASASSHGAGTSPSSVGNGEVSSGVGCCSSTTTSSAASCSTSAAAGAASADAGAGISSQRSTTTRRRLASAALTRPSRKASPTHSAISWRRNLMAPPPWSARAGQPDRRTDPG